jgi:uncharacterized protein YceH (UPF0502 family)
MSIQLNPLEVRVLGALIEKELTTPDYYPLTLNALSAACNQKSNRDPMMQVAGPEVVRTLDSLRQRKLAWEATSTVANRVPKYSHGAKDALMLSQSQLAVMCELMVRGPQTAAELRNHAARMIEFADVNQVVAILTELMQRPDGALVVKLPREPGKREERYAHLLGGPVTVSETPTEPARLTVMAENDRIAALEAKVTALQDEMARLRAELSDFAAQFK